MQQDDDTLVFRAGIKDTGETNDSGSTAFSGVQLYPDGPVIRCSDAALAKKVETKLDKAGVTAGSFLVGAGEGEMVEKTPAEVLKHIAAAPAGLLHGLRTCWLYWQSTV